MRQWKATAESIEMAEKLRRQQMGDVEVFDVWEENWEAWMFFLDVSPQWIYAGMSAQRVGLNWPSIEVVARAVGWRRRRWRELVEALLVVERAVLIAESEQR